jgi:hypothetical protein|tara:strand:+ start:221 stop:454 length:234 start_codon:yes stop_codon:yes gene_type:complete
MNYTAKKTRHKYSERYKIIAEDGAKGEIVKWDENDWRICYGKMVVCKKHPTMDEAAEYAFSKAREITEWAKTNVISV